MQSTERDTHPGLSPRWNTAAMVAVVVAILVLVPMIPPQGDPPPETIPTTQPTSCDPDDTLCQAVDLLEDLADCDGLTDAQCRAVHMAAQGVAEAEGIDVPATTRPTTTTTTAPPRATTTTTSTTTTSTSLPPPEPVADVVDRIDDLLGVTPPTTIPEGAGDGG